MSATGKWKQLGRKFLLSAQAILFLALGSIMMPAAHAAPKKPTAAAAKPAPKKVAPAKKIISGNGPVVHTIAELDAPLYYGEYFWDETGVPKGPADIVVDLTEEQLYVYRGGVEIARTVITRGWDKHATPTGTFPILEKDADHYSSTYDNAPMPFNLRLTWDGVAIHGANVDNEAATHGCVGIPLEFAAKLFKVARVGDRVFITNKWKPEVYKGT
jgi:lipoprotein-anchoring transpeptidase ErfK/SrfK